METLALDTKMSISNYTENELLVVLREALAEGKEERKGMTTAELTEALGIKDERVRKMLRTLIGNHEVACQKVPMIAINGSRALIPEYYLVKKN